MDLSLMIEGQMGLNWPRWRRIVALAEDAGLAAVHRSDHFVSPSPPDEDSLELVTSLTWLASNTRRIRFGPLVSPVSFRDPVTLARTAASLGQLGDGRYVLGMGAGWMEREHDVFGYELGDVPTRFARLEEGLEVVTRLLRDPGPVTFEGRFFRLRDAELRPRPDRAPPVLVGGNGIRRTLPLAARYADAWNGIYLTPSAFAERGAALDRALEAAGRPPSAVRRSLMTGLRIGGDESLRARGALAGTLGEVAGQLRALEDAGCQEVMLQWLALDDLDGLRTALDALM